jgi:hypothetical protein
VMVLHIVGGVGWRIDELINGREML